MRRLDLGGGTGVIFSWKIEGAELGKPLTCEGEREGAVSNGI